MKHWVYVVAVVGYTKVFLKRTTLKNEKKTVT